MTYKQRPVCRRGGCGRPVSEFPASNEGDLGFCDEHRLAVRSVRDRLTSAAPGRVKPERVNTRKGAAK